MVRMAPRRDVWCAGATATVIVGILPALVGWMRPILGALALALAIAWRSGILRRLLGCATV